mgnify:CR=1 FL=1
MFNDKYGLTQAVLEGHKTQTRRIAYADYVKNPNTCIGLKNNERNKLFFKNGNVFVAKSRYKIGEEIAVAQHYSGIIPNLVCDLEKIEKLLLSGGLANKMFVKADIMPHRICITDIRVERLQDIGDRDCFAEGIQRYLDVHGYMYGFSYIRRGALRVELSTTPREAYANLIDKICGKGTWEKNPFVFVYDFKLVR